MGERREMRVRRKKAGGAGEAGEAGEAGGADVCQLPIPNPKPQTPNSKLLLVIGFPEALE